MQSQKNPDSQKNADDQKNLDDQKNTDRNGNEQQLSGFEKDSLGQIRQLVVFTDGACRGNPGRGGWAWAVEGGRYASGFDPMTTNQRMEIRAVLEAVRTLEDPLTIASDSAYVVNCFKQRWYIGWQRRGWRNSSGQPVANQDLWEPLLALALDPSRPVKFMKVQGHSGDPMNDLVDRLAVEAATTGEGRSGTGRPG